MFEAEAYADRSVATKDVRSAARALRQLTLAAVLGLVVSGCAITFGSDPESTDSMDRSPEETRRVRNRLFLEEQERIERGRSFDRVGPPSDR